MEKYVAVLRKTSESDFGVEFLDLPGCFSAGCQPTGKRTHPPPLKRTHPSVQVFVPELPKTPLFRFCFIR